MEFAIFSILNISEAEIEMKMTKSRIILAGILLFLATGFLGLVRSADVKHLERQEVNIEIPDTFEK